jgi:hypothetical protein
VAPCNRVFVSHSGTSAVDDLTSSADNVAAT